ncbi:hypothetical protein C1H46_013532 [Malus baccata]|uniref:Transposase (putative) gypsy type domain-containing protein n=1 Tax=Malus baccata TaxID=106549 RepID=A0A540MQE2_MALBA|nr:hypothetical protein C1H46_013532 [Malus baccata]
MLRRTPWSKYGGTPPPFEIVKARDLGHVPDDIHLSPLPAGVDMYSGLGIPAGSTILSPDHLEVLSFPLHPMIHLILFFTNTHPMQLNPNSYLIMSTFLALGLKLGVSLGFRDFLYLFDLTVIKGETSFFNFKPRYRKKFLSLGPSRARDWKNRPLLISGNWKAPELSQLSIPSAFGPKPGIYKFTFIIFL